MNGGRVGYEINIKEFKKLVDELEKKTWKSSTDKAETLKIINEFINENSLLNQVLRLERGGGLGVEIMGVIDKLIPPKSKKNKQKPLKPEGMRNIFKGVFDEGETTRKKIKTTRKTLDEEFAEIDKMWDDFDDKMELL